MEDERSVVTRAAIAQTARRQVENAEQQGDEHIVVVALAERLVDRLDHLRRIVFMGRSMAQKRQGHRHHHRGRDALAADVTDAEEELLVPEEEVEQVAADILCRCHGGIEVDVTALGERREYPRKHIELDGIRDFQLAFDGSFLGRCRLQLVDVLHQGLLHVAEGMGQLADLVAAAVVGQFLVEMALGDGPGLVGQFPKGLQLADDDAAEHEEHQDEADDDDE